MESAEQPANQLHQKTQRSLEQMGHHDLTVPPQDRPVLTEQAKQWIEGQYHDAVHLAHTAINPDESAKIRIAKKQPAPIVIGRWIKKKLLRKTV